MVGLTLHQVENLAKELEEQYKNSSEEEIAGEEIAVALCNKAYKEGLLKSISIIESYKVSVGNSASGELACEWTMENLREIRNEIRELLNG